MWDRFGATRKLAQARAAELRGDLERAATLFADAGRYDEAARVMILRGDSETDLSARLRHYVLAASTAPEGSASRTLARRKRAGALLSRSIDGPITAALRQDLLEAAHELEALDELEAAAEAFGRAGDVEGEARTLARAGDVDRLDALLHAQQSRDRSTAAQRDLRERVAVLAASGKRREAAALALSSADDAVRETGRSLQARRVSGDVVNVSVHGHDVRVVLGDEITIGRVATLSIASAAVSRQHVAVARCRAGAVVRDLGSRNGTTLRGHALAGEVPVGDGIEVRLGDQVPLSIRPTKAHDGHDVGSFTIDFAGARYLAPLGPAMLGVGRWRLERGPDAWVELVTDDDPPAFAEALSLGSRISLLAGDAFSEERTGEPVLRVEGT